MLAEAEICPANGVFFDYHLRRTCRFPRRRRPERGATAAGLLAQRHGDRRCRPAGDGRGAEKSLRPLTCDPKDVSFVVPHQAGSGIVRLAAMQLEGLGVGGEVINGLTREVANISSSSVPYAMKRQWDRLDGIVLCPTAGVGNPGEATVTRGCVILRATRVHRLAVALGQSLRRAS